MLDLRSGFVLTWGAQATQPPFTPLTYSGIVETNDDVSQTIAWHVTPAAQGQVIWGTSSGVYPNATPLELNFLTFHSQVIGAGQAGNPALTPDTDYFYKIRGYAVSGGDPFDSPEGTFHTLAAPAPPPSTNAQAWVATEQATMVPPALASAAGTTLSPGTYTGAQWKAWVNSLPNGSSATWTNAVATGCTINLSGSDTNVWAGKSYIKLTFTDSVLNAQQTSANGSNSGYWVMRGASHHIWVADGTTDGHWGSVGVLSVQGDGSLAPLTGKGDTHHIRYSNHTWLRSSGFGIYLTSLDSGANPPGSGWPTAYWIHDCFIESPFQGYSLIAARHFMGQRNVFRDIQGSYCDFESEYHGNGLDGVFLSGDTVRRYGWQNNNECRLINSVPSYTEQNTTISLVDGVLIPQNDVVIENIYVPEGYAGTTGAGRGGWSFRANKSNPKSNWIIDGVICDQTSSVASTYDTMIAGNNFTNLVVRNCKAIMADHGTMYRHSADTASGSFNVPDVNVSQPNNQT